MLTMMPSHEAPDETPSPTDVAETMRSIKMKALRDGIAEYDPWQWKDERPRAVGVDLSEQVVELDQIIERMDGEKVRIQQTGGSFQHSPSTLEMLGLGVLSLLDEHIGDIKTIGDHLEPKRPPVEMSYFRRHGLAMKVLSYEQPSMAALMKRNLEPILNKVQSMVGESDQSTVKHKRWNERRGGTVGHEEAPMVAEPHAPQASPRRHRRRPKRPQPA